MPRGRVAKVLMQRFDGSTFVRRPDHLIVEEPLEIRLDGALVTTTMRTPGHDFELASGFCHTEGLLGEAKVRQCRYCATGSAVESPAATDSASFAGAPRRNQQRFNVVSVETGGQAPVPTPRLTTTTSSCGICGTTAIDELRERLHPLPASPPIPVEVLASMAGRVTEQQQLFGSTGGVHAAVAFAPDGEALLLREDIGRHNAVDKVVGRLLLDDRLPASGLGLWVSGRASFEIVQKAWAAGFGTVVAVSAPSSLAVDAAWLANITLCGFAREGRLNQYTKAAATDSGDRTRPVGADSVSRTGGSR